MPPRRLGRLLAEARLDKGLTVAEVSDAIGGSLDEIELLEVETGRRALGESDLQSLSELYGLSTSSMVPDRSQLVIDLDEGVIDANGTSADLADGTTVAGREEVLSKYLALVYAMRGQEPGSPVTLRLADLEVLAEALASDRRTIEDELVSLMVVRPEPVKKRFRLLRGRTVVPVVGVLVASTTAGALVFDVKDSSAQADRPAATDPAIAPTAIPAVVIDDAAFQDRAEDGTPGPVQVRLSGTATDAGDTPAD